MRIIEAIQAANAHVQEDSGVAADPVYVRLMKRGQRKCWIVVYSADVFNRDAFESCTTIDGGEYIVTIDDEKGIVIDM